MTVFILGALFVQAVIVVAFHETLVALDMRIICGELHIATSVWLLNSVGRRDLYRLAKVDEEGIRDKYGHVFTGPDGLARCLDDDTPLSKWTPYRHHPDDTREHRLLVYVVRNVHKPTLIYFFAASNLFAAIGFHYYLG
jgi:hypothetical protein